MKIIRSVKQMQAYSDALRKSDTKIGLVPTMGFLHEGHISLIKLARQYSDTVVVTIFVNPMQFGPSEDFKDYPRDFERDVQMIKEAGADAVFAPEVHEIYPEGFQTAITVDRVSKNLCGASRPTHFRGVATVVAKLFTCTKPHTAVFGEKDFQQLAVIKRMTADLNFDIEILPAPIIREPDGLAMSSRNTYLSKAQRRAALSLYRSLLKAREMVQSGITDCRAVINEAQKIIEAEPEARVDYIKICDTDTIEDIETINSSAVMALAVYFGRARLIDNIVLTVHNHQEGLK